MHRYFSFRNKYPLYPYIIILLEPALCVRIILSYYIHVGPKPMATAVLFYYQVFPHPAPARYSPAKLYGVLPLHQGSLISCTPGMWGGLVHAGGQMRV